MKHLFLVLFLALPLLSQAQKDTSFGYHLEAAGICFKSGMVMTLCGSAAMAGSISAEPHGLDRYKPLFIMGAAFALQGIVITYIGFDHIQKAGRKAQGLAFNGTGITYTF